MKKDVKANRLSLSMLFMALFATPLVASLGAIIGLTSGGFLLFVIVASLVFAGAVWTAYLAKAKLQEPFFLAALPLIISYCYYQLVWIVTFGFSHYGITPIAMLDSLFAFATAPYHIANFLLRLFGTFNYFPILQAGILIFHLILLLVTWLRKKRKIYFDKYAVVCLCAVVCVSAVAAFQLIERNNSFLDRDSQVGRVYEEVDYHLYSPFSHSERVKTFDNADLEITSNYPKLDGATAAYPVYSSIAQSVYKGLSEETAYEYIFCTTTGDAFERLLNGEIDIFFGAQPSTQQLERADELGVVLEQTPLAREAFVFFVNNKNPIESLSIEQIQDIYLGKITNWKELGGNDEEIIAFQRPENSGSQTIMLARVMEGKPLPLPLYEEQHTNSMVDVINSVAEYRNYSSAIGYSFRYFATEMYPNNDIKLVAIDGVTPTIENIEQGLYPLTISSYAITAGTSNPNVKPLLDWIQSEQGQELIEECGYVRN